MQTTDFINNIDVVYEEVAVENIDDFIITPVTNEKPLEPKKDVSEESQVTLTFDLPVTPQAKRSEVTKHELISKIDEIKVVGHEQVSPEPSSDGKIRYGLEDFMDKEEKVINKAVSKPLDEELQFDVRVDKKPNLTTINKEEEDVSPLNLTISELQSKAEERRQKMKEFNYKFNTRLNKNIDEIESQPAYKRMGVDLEDVEPSAEVSPTNQSRTTLDIDDNNDIQLRSNNSFLHDNVD